MKHIIAMAALVALGFTSLPAAAQTAQAGALAGAQSGSQSASLSASQGGSVTFNSPSQVSTRQSGSTTLKYAPAVTAPSMGSGHPCGLSGSVGISIIGGGASGGASYVDEACLLAQMGQGEAALVMIAQRDGAACRALRQVGRIAASSQCKDDPKRPRSTVSSNSGGASVAVLFSKCDYDKAANKVTFRPKSSRDRDAAKAQCMASLGF